MSSAYPPSSSADSAGLMSPETYQKVTGTPPTDNTAAIPTTGATGVYTEATATNVVSTIDPTITNLAYRRCHDNGHAGTNKLIPVLLFPGFTSDGLTEFPDSMTRRMAGYVDPATGRAPLVIKLRTRGRGNLGSIDHARDTQDAIDLLDAAIAAAGSNVQGTSAICIGYSTGALDALLFATKFPDRCLGVVLYYPNYDLGADEVDSYYVLQSPTNRAIVAASRQPGGDVRLLPGAGNRDQYIACNAIDAIAQIMAIPGGPHVWLIGDSDDPEILPSRERLRDALQAIPEAKAKAHIHITKTGDANRVLHADGDNSAAAIYAERYYFPFLLKNAAEWTMPKESPPWGLRILGMIKTRLFEIWLGPNTKPKTAAGAGGRDHAADFCYDDNIDEYIIKPVTTTNGYIQVIKGADNRTETFTATAEKRVDLNEIKTITNVTDIGIEKSWVGGTNVTESGGAGTGVTAWVDAIGGVDSFAASANKPAWSTDANGKKFIEFTASSSQKLILSKLLVDPKQDYTIFVTFKKTNTTAGAILEILHRGTLARHGVMYYASGNDNFYSYNDNGTWSIENTNGLGGHPISQNNIHVIAFMRKSGVMYVSLDGSAWSKSPIAANELFTQTDTGSPTNRNETTIGCGWANGGGAYWQFFTGGVYQIDSKQAATSEDEIASHFALMKTNHQF